MGSIRAAHASTDLHDLPAIVADLHRFLWPVLQAAAQRNRGRAPGRMAARGKSGSMDAVPRLARITRDHGMMGGRRCIRGMRVTVGTIVGLLAQGHSREAVLEAYPCLQAEDLAEALTYAAWRAMEVEVEIGEP